MSPSVTTQARPASTLSSTAATPLTEIARETPDLAAYLLPRGRRGRRAQSFRTVSYRRLDDRSDVVAAGLRATGIERGTHVALLIPVGEELFVTAFALLKLGAVPVLVDPGIGTAHLKTCLREAEVGAFIGSAKAHAARQLFSWCPGASIRVLVGHGPATRFGAVRFRDVERNGAQVRFRIKAELRRNSTGAPRPEGDDEIAAIAFTSGSTGVPKGVEYRTRHLLAQARILRKLYDITPGEVCLATFPPFALLGPALGITTVMPQMDFTAPASVNPRRIINAVNSTEASMMFGSPALLETVSRWGVVKGAQMPTMHRVISAGAPVPRSTQRRMLNLLPSGAEVHTPYGATEALPVTSIGSTELLAARSKGICVGRPVPAVDLVLVPVVDGPIPNIGSLPPVEVGEIGEIVVRGANVTEAYHGRPESTGLAKTQWDGRLAHRMGDAGYFDAKGRLWFCGRVSHRVTTPEGTMWSVPCEEVLNESPLVNRSALVGVGPAGSQRPVFVVELERRDNDTPETARQLLGLAAASSLTNNVRTVLFAPKLPVDIRHNSKIRREELAEWAARRLS